jgi:hypothetical protein
MKNNQQILQLLSNLNGLENSSQQLNLNSLEVSQSFNQFLKRLNTCEASVLSRSSESVTSILNRVSLLHFILIMNQIDENFPGLSFYYVMEARSSENVEGKFFIQRLNGLNKKGLLSEIFAPMRNRLINGLLTETDLKNSGVSKVLEDIKNNFNVAFKDMETIKDILLSASYKKVAIQLPVLRENEIISLLNNTLSDDIEEDYFDEDDEE